MSESWTAPKGPISRDIRPVEWNSQPVDRVVKPAFQSISNDDIPVLESQDPISTPPKGLSDTPPPEPEQVSAKPVVDPALENEMKHQLALLASALDEVASVDEDLQERMLEQVTELGLTLAGELAAGAIEIEPQRVSTLVREALALMEEESVVHVRIHPEIFSKLDQENLLDDLKANPRIQIRMDAAVGELGCVVESPHKRVDTRVYSRIIRVRHLMKQEKEDQS